MLVKACSWTGALAVPFSSLLFFLRIKGIYHNSRVILFVFSLLWLSTWSTLLFPISYNIKRGQVDQWAWCWVPQLNRWSCIPFVALAIFDTAVVSAITARVALNNQAKSFGEKVNFIIFAEDISHVARSLLRSGQVYYM
jgi:hypothetical protein